MSIAYDKLTGTTIPKPTSEQSAQAQPAVKNYSQMSETELRKLPLKELKQAAAKDRQANGVTTPQPQQVVSVQALQAPLEYWFNHADAAANFYQSEFNYTSLVNCFTTLVFREAKPAIPETVAEAHEICVRGNHLEFQRRTDANGATVRRRGEPAHNIPPTLYPAYAWPAQEAAASEAALQQMIDSRETEIKRAKAMPFNQLKAEATANRKPEARGWEGFVQ